MRPLSSALLLFTLFASSARADQESVRRRPPHYLGKPPAAGAAVARGPVLTGRSFMEPGPARALIEKLDAARPAFEAALDSLVAPVPAGLDGAAFADGAPAVYAGSPTGFYAPQPMGGDGDDPARDAVLIRTGDPSSAWRSRIRAAADSARASHVLIVALELSDYPLRQKNWKGGKAVDLAAGHTLPVPWLTSLDQPVEVVQWTGALYRADGRFVRGGAEAFAALRTPFMESAAGLRRTMSADVLAEALGATRDDLPGAPAAWRVALANLVAELTGRPRLAGGAVQGDG